MDNVPPPSTPEAKHSIARQTAVGSSYSIAASSITLVVGFIRAVVLARLLFPTDFGLFTLAFFYVGLLERVQFFGFTAAFIHRQEHTNEEAAAHFILRMTAAILVAVLALLVPPLLFRFYPDLPQLSRVVIVMAAIRILRAFNSTPKTILTKQLQFRRLSYLKVLGSLLALGLTGWLAWRGAGVWSLVAQDFSIIVVEFVGLWLFRPPWKISLKTRWSVIKWYFQFGKFHILSRNIAVLLDTFDDFWIGTFLGGNSLGFYAKAYELAHYPRAVVAQPVNSVFFPAFARLQDDRQRLSRAFYRAASLLVRVGFLLAGIFMLITPEFITLFLGNKWQPMQIVFQLMLIYTLLDPILAFITQLILAKGQPSLLVRVQIWQMLFFVPAVILASAWYGINGVAIVADLMLLIGFLVLVPRLRQFVDFSLRQLIGVPLLALIAALSTAALIMTRLPEAHNAVTLAQKGLLVYIIYTSVLLLFEREQLQEVGQLIWQLLKRKNQESNA